MKKNIVMGIGIIILGATTVFAQQHLAAQQVPSIVINKFQKSFPAARDIEWKQSGNQYKVEFELGSEGYDHDLWLNANGDVEQHKEEIAPDRLPPAVSSKLANDYKNARVKEAEKITAKGKVTYKVELKDAAGDLKVLLNESGAIENTYRD